MEKFTKIQEDWLLGSFFYLPSCAGWRTIASRLIQDGKCIVAGDGKIWIGGVGNFIKTSPAEGAVSCTLLTFQHEEFFAWEEYKNALEAELTIRNTDLRVLQVQVSELSLLKKK